MFSKTVDTGIKTMFIGLDNAGKTLLINKAGALQPAIAPAPGSEERDYYTHPTVGLHYVELNKFNRLFKIYDMSGAGRYRSMWRSYYDYIQCLVYVVDRTDRSRIGSSVSELKEIREIVVKKKLPFVVVLNKTEQDDEDKDELIESLHLNKLYISYLTCLYRDSALYDVVETNAYAGLGIDQLFQLIQEKVPLSS